MKKMFPRPLHQRAHYSLLALALLTGCATHPGPPRPNEAPLQQFASKGYLSEEQFSLYTSPMAWTVAGHNLDFLLSVPVRPGKYPLVIYLPGLGESRSAGDGWRNAWAQAGYAVLSIQLLTEDGQAWQSQAARNGDFKSLVQERYSAAAMESRLAALGSLIEELKRRKQEPLLQNVDSSRIVLAGYDIGAYTAMAAAGERITNTDKHIPLPLAGVIALSPHASFSGPAFDSRYGAISVPVLSITGQGDSDSYASVPSASLRTAPFQHMPAGGKFLLMLEDTSHATLAGNPMNTMAENSPQRTQERNNGDTESPPGGSRQGGQGGGRKRGSGEGRGGDGAAGNRSQEGGTMGRERNAGGGDWSFSLAAIRSVSTAFLDARIKQDDIAEDWLRKDARRWLRDTASLTVK